MRFEEYFQREVLALRGLAREAMQRNPALEPFFGTPGRDADVERLIESFAFLMARLQQKLDDDLPEITQPLFSQLWPNYLRPLPAASIIQYEPGSNTTNTSAIPRGTLVESMPVDGTRCQFRTIYDVDLLPLKVTEQRMIERNGMTVIAVRFALIGGNLQTLQLSDLRVFFTGEHTIPHTLYLTLTHRLKELRCVIKDNKGRENITAVLPPSCVTPLGFHKDEGMLPYSDSTALGYRILQEYFCYPEKFLFVRIADLQQGLSQEIRQRFSNAGEFELHFVLDHRPEGYESFHAKNWNLYCTPVINIFPVATQQQQMTHGTFGHKIVPDAHFPNHYTVYNIEQAETWTKRQGRQIASQSDYIPFFKNAPRYRLHIVPTPDGECMETYIQMDGADEPNLFVTLQLLCTNRDLPARLGLGDICMVAGSAEAAAAPFKNILPVSHPSPPPYSNDILWKLLSNMSLNTVALTDVSAFRAMIATYAFRTVWNFTQAKLLDKHLQSIRAIKSPSTDMIFNGLPRRGGQTTIIVDQSCFPCEGAMYLFGSVLNEFLSMYATVNSFHQLIINEASSGEEYHWPARLGSILRR